MKLDDELKLSLVCFQQEFFDSLEGAIHSVETSGAWAAIEFPKNYSYWLDQRIRGLFSANEQAINGSTIRLHADMTGKYQNIAYL